MIAGLVYLIAAPVTGLHALGSMFIPICGLTRYVPHPLGVTAVAGSVAVLIASGLSFAGLFAGSVVALCGCLMLMVFHVVGLSRYASMIAADWDSLDIVVLIPTLLLLAATGCAVRGVVKRFRPALPPTESPNRVVDAKGIAITIGGVLAVIHAATMIGPMLGEFRSDNAQLYGHTLLNKAVLKGDLLITRRILGKWADPDPLDESGQSDLGVAITYNKIGTMKALIAAGADVNQPSAEGGSTPLHYAAGATRLDAVKLLLKSGAKVDAKNKIGKTPLMYALHPWGSDIFSKDTPRWAVIEVLLQAGADVNARDEVGLTPLHMAMPGMDPRNSARIAELLLEYGADVNALDEFGKTPLDRAGADDSSFARLLKSKGGKSANLYAVIQSGDIDKLKESLKLLPDINQMPKGPWTLLMSAAGGGKTEAVKLLLDRGANVNDSAEQGTALHSAAMAGHADIIELLLDHGANVNAKMKRGVTPLHLAAIGSKTAASRVLIERGADVQAMSQSDYTLSVIEGRNPLGYAASAGNKELVALLLDKGASPDVGSVNGETPLMIAADRNHVEVAQLLLDRGANVNLRDRHGRSALGYALDHTMKELLQKHGGKP